MLAAYARFIRENYTMIIISTLVLGIVVGLFTPVPGMAIRKISSFLIIIMIGAMGFTITFKSLGTAARDWKSFVLGLVLNFVFAPLLCWLLALLILANHPDFATGLILIGVVPCAGMALVWAGLLKGDVPLAMVINAATMLVAPFLIPFLMRLLAGTFVSIDTMGMFKTVMLTVLLPVIGGIVLREVVQKTADVRKYLPVMPAISATTAIFLMFMAITFSSGMKNLPIAVGIAVMSFKGLIMFPIAVAFAFQMLTAVSFYQLFLRTLPSDGQAKGAPPGKVSEIHKNNIR